MNLVMELNSWVKKKFGEAISTVYGNKTAIRTIDYDENAGFIKITTTDVTTTALQIEVPENTNEYTIFHQTCGARLYYGDENITTDGPYLEANDVLKISGKNDFEIYGITSTGTITVYVVVTSRS